MAGSAPKRDYTYDEVMRKMETGTYNFPYVYDKSTEKKRRTQR